MRILSHAKINLYLHVTSKRKDGYHNLDSLIAFTNLYDVIEFRKAKDFKLQIKGPFAKEIKNDNTNLILATAKLLKDKFNIEGGVNIKLTKNIPVQAGLGGGSANAAATLIALNKLWKLNLSERKLN